jgi:hypothetical protein
MILLPKISFSTSSMLIVESNHNSLIQSFTTVSVEFSFHWHNIVILLQQLHFHLILTNKKYRSHRRKTFHLLNQSTPREPSTSSSISSSRKYCKGEGLHNKSFYNNHHQKVVRTSLFTNISHLCIQRGV